MLPCLQRILTPIGVNRLLVHRPLSARGKTHEELDTAIRQIVSKAVAADEVIDSHEEREPTLRYRRTHIG